ncbi:hypothetical protein GX553_00015 [Candidatus Peribacteria bacterium]|nr:hypothetical protein [Candidatus Peribacteria bacterium]
MRTILATIVLAGMSAMLAAALVYRWQQNQQTILTLAAIQEREEIQTTLTETLERLSACHEMLSGSGTEYGCGPLNAVKTDTVVPYIDEKHGIIVDLPYNNNWGYGIHVPAPYQELHGIDGILFGPPREISTCTWTHSMQITFLPTRTEEEMRQDIENRQQSDMNPLAELQEPTPYALNDIQAFAYTVPGYCELYTIEVFLQEWNILFSACKEQAEDLATVTASLRETEIAGNELP